MLKSPHTFHSLTGSTAGELIPNEICDLSVLYNKTHSSQSIHTTVDQIQEEIDKLPSLYQGFIQKDEDASDAALRFWKNQEMRQRLPNLRIVADRYLACVGSSCPSESCFSFLSHVMSKKRTRCKIPLIKSLGQLWNEFRDPNLQINLKLLSELTMLSSQNVKQIRRVEHFAKFGLKNRSILTHPRRLGAYKRRNPFSVNPVTDHETIPQDTVNDNTDSFVVEEQEEEQSFVESCTLTQDTVNDNTDSFEEEGEVKLESSVENEVDWLPPNECDEDDEFDFASCNKSINSTVTKETDATENLSYVEIDAHNSVFFRPYTSIEERELTRENYDKLFQDVLQDATFVSIL